MWDGRARVLLLGVLRSPLARGHGVIRAVLGRALAAWRVRRRTCPVCSAVDCTAEACGEERLEWLTW